MFFDAKSIDEIASKLANTIPPGLNHLKEDLEKNFHAVLQGALSKLDLVTREEFEVQKLVLAKTRANLETLEQRVAALEQQVLSKEEL
jgi:BMFP domain-containing protein YqiC